MISSYGIILSCYKKRFSLTLQVSSSWQYPDYLIWNFLGFSLEVSMQLFQFQFLISIFFIAVFLFVLKLFLLMLLLLADYYYYCFFVVVFAVVSSTFCFGCSNDRNRYWDCSNFVRLYYKVDLKAIKAVLQNFKNGRKSNSIWPYSPKLVWAFQEQCHIIWN